ncbi:uncharacterized protein PAC_01506 [Phialocephala subalpina]|uniref:N-acetyltransferase domain-containing protein n=1 Tax=Phialocephala subalpina TaxID=576137 RepID=A0A1L7WFW0_9HELO|nr:uncharacterized protein PAC_01506 [Phialocephala subalpina]
MDIQYPNLESAQTSRIYLEPLTLEKHLEDFHELWTSEEAVQWSTKLVMHNLEQTREFMPKTLNNEQNPEIDKFAIMLKDVPENTKAGIEVKNAKGEAKCIGITGTNRWSPQGMETGYCLNREYWGRGFATEAFALFLKWYWTFPQRQNIKFLVAKTDPRNGASLRVLEKCGGRKGEIITLTPAWVKDGGTIEATCWYFDRPEFGAS